MSVELHLSSEEIKALRAREGAKSESDLTFRTCPLCAFPTRIRTQMSGTGKTEVWLDVQICGRCEERRYQAPMVFELIVLALRGSRLLDRWTKKEEGGQR